MIGKMPLKRADEAGRQCALDRLGVLDTEPEPEFEKITTLVQTVLNVPIAAVILIDRDRQWFKSIKGLEVSETPRTVAFCDQTIRSSDCYRVENATSHPQFHDNPLVTGPPHIRAYLGAPLITPDGYALGSLCAIDSRPRIFTEDQERVLVSFADLVMNQLELRKMAAVDPLTGVATRRAFVDAMDTAIAEAQKTGTPISLVCLDLDRFKAINDSFGHQVGDAVLSAVGQTLQRECPDTALAGRLGGEELAVLLFDADTFQAIDFAEQLRKTIEAQSLPGWPDIAFTASFGVASWQPDMTAKTWMAAADAALYRAKGDGRNCVARENITDYHTQRNSA